MQTARANRWSGPLSLIVAALIPLACTQEIFDSGGGTTESDIIVKGGGGEDDECGGESLLLTTSSFEEESWGLYEEDLAVPHVSTVPAIAGQTVNMFVRHITNGDPRYGAVLFTSSGTLSSLTSSDFDYKNYNFAESLAKKGFDVYLMDQTGYGFSPRPTMDDPCNANPAQQNLLVPNPLAAPCPASYPFRLVNITTEWPEIDTVVEFIRDDTQDVPSRRHLAQTEDHRW